MSAAAGVQSRSDRWAPWAVLALTFAALAAGWVLRTSTEGRTRLIEDSASGVSLTVPETWRSATPQEGETLAARDSQDPTTRVAASVIDLGDRKAETVQRGYIFQLGQTLKSFRVIDPPSAVTVGGDAAVRFTYAYVDDPAAQNPESRQYPVVIAGEATLIARGGKLYALTATTGAARLADHADVLERIVQSVHLP